MQKDIKKCRIDDTLCYNQIKKRGKSMKNFRILVYNGSGVIVHDETVKAIDENNAIIDVLKDITIYSDDTIKVEEI